MLVAPGVLAVPVSVDDGAPDRRWDRAGAAADVERLAAPGHDDAADAAVAGDAPGGLGTYRPEVIEVAASLDGAR